MNRQDKEVEGEGEEEAGGKSTRASSRPPSATTKPTDDNQHTIPS